MQTQRRADGGGDGAKLAGAGELLELGRQIGHVGFAQVSADHAFGCASLRQNVVAGQARAHGLELLRGGGDVGFGRSLGQFDHDLTQRDQTGRGAVALVAKIKDIDPAIDDDGVGQLAGLELIDHGLDGRLQRITHDPARVARHPRVGGRRRGELLGHGLEGRALNDLLHQLARAVQRGLRPAHAGGVDIDFAQQELRLGGGFVQATQFLIDLQAAGAGAAVETAGHQLAPANLGAQVLAEGGGLDAALLQELQIVGRGRARGAGHFSDFLIHLFVGDLQALELGHLLNLQAILDQGVQRRLLDGGQILLGRLHLRRGDQHQHPLTQVIAGDDLVVDGGDDAVGHFELRLGARRRGRFLGRRIGRAGGDALAGRLSRSLGGPLRAGLGRLAMGRTGEQDRR